MNADDVNDQSVLLPKTVLEIEVLPPTPSYFTRATNYLKSCGARLFHFAKSNLNPDVLEDKKLVALHIASFIFCLFNLIIGIINLVSAKEFHRVKCTKPFYNRNHFPIDSSLKIHGIACTTFSGIIMFSQICHLFLWNYIKPLVLVIISLFFGYFSCLIVSLDSGANNFKCLANEVRAVLYWYYVFDIYYAIFIAFLPVTGLIIALLCIFFHELFEPMLRRRF